MMRLLLVLFILPILAAGQSVFRVGHYAAGTPALNFHLSCQQWNATIAFNNIAFGVLTPLEKIEFATDCNVTTAFADSGLPAMEPVLLTANAGIGMTFAVWSEQAPNGTSVLVPEVIVVLPTPPPEQQATIRFVGLAPRFDSLYVFLNGSLVTNVTFQTTTDINVACGHYALVLANTSAGAEVVLTENDAYFACGTSYFVAFAGWSELSLHQSVTFEFSYVQLRAAAFVPDVAQLDVYYDNGIMPYPYLPMSLPYQRVTDYISVGLVASLQPSLLVLDGNNGQHHEARLPVAFVTGGVYTLIAHGLSANMSLQLLTEPAQAPSSRNNARLRFFQASALPGDVDCWADGMRMSAGLPPAVSRGYAETSASVTLLRVFPSGQTSNPMASTSVALSGGAVGSVFLVGDPTAGFRLIYTADAAFDTYISLRVRHSTPDLGPVTVTVNGGPLIQQPVAFGGTTDYVDLPLSLGDYPVQLLDAHQQVVFTATAFLNRSWPSYTLALSGLFAATPPTLTLTSMPDDWILPGITCGMRLVHLANGLGPQTLWVGDDEQTKSPITYPDSSFYYALHGGPSNVTVKDAAGALTATLTTNTDISIANVYSVFLDVTGDGAGRASIVFDGLLEVAAPLRVINLLPQQQQLQEAMTTAVDVFFDSTIGLSAIPFRSASNYTALLGWTQYDVFFVPAGTVGPVLATSSFSLPFGVLTTDTPTYAATLLAVAPSAGGTASFAVVEDNLIVDADKAKVRLLHAALACGALEFSVGGTVVSSDVGQLTASEFVSVDPTQKQSVSISVSGDGTPLASADYQFAAGSAYTLCVSSESADSCSALRVDLFTDRGSSATPNGNTPSDHDTPFLDSPRAIGVIVGTSVAVALLIVAGGVYGIYRYRRRRRADYVDLS